MDTNRHGFEGGTDREATSVIGLEVTGKRRIRVLRVFPAFVCLRVHSWFAVSDLQISSCTTLPPTMVSTALPRIGQPSNGQLRDFEAENALR
jgi:hypothetical protein